MLLHKHELYTRGQLKEMGFNTRSPLNVKRYPSSRATNNVNGCTYTTLSLGFPPGTALRPLTLPRYSNSSAAQKPLYGMPLLLRNRH